MADSSSRAMIVQCRLSQHWHGGGTGVQKPKTLQMATMTRRCRCSECAAVFFFSGVAVCFCSTTDGNTGVVTNTIAVHTSLRHCVMIAALAFCHLPAGATGPRSTGAGRTSLSVQSYD